MEFNTKIAVLALIGSLTAASAYAADQDSFDITQAAIGYSDGYTGTDNQFHAWQHRADAEEFRAKYMARYRPWRHDDPRHKDSQ